MELTRGQQHAEQLAEHRWQYGRASLHFKRQAEFSTITTTTQQAQATRATTPRRTFRLNAHCRRHQYRHHHRHHQHHTLL
jgi:hypothetical protein